MEMELTCSDELTVPELKTVCKQRNIGGYSRLKKDDLVKLCCGKKGAPSKVTSSEQTCKLMLTTAAIAGKLQNHIMNDINKGLELQGELKGADEYTTSTIDESIGLLFESAMNLKLTPVIYVKRFSDRGCNNIVARSWTDNRVQELDDIARKSDRIIDKMATLSPEIAERFR